MMEERKKFNKKFVKKNFKRTEYRGRDGRTREEREAEEKKEALASWRSEEHTSELQSHSFISYAVFCLKKKKQKHKDNRQQS